MCAMKYLYITDAEELDKFIARAQKSSVLAIDTEFLREKTYFPMLCLLQMATDDEVVIVDPFKVHNLCVLAPLMRNENIVKIFHAAKQDLEIIYREVKQLPWPVFDTQIAATLMGQMQQIGYANLISVVCGTRLKKTDSFTDWSARPLKDSQLRYAAEDVIYLPLAYQKMKEQLEVRGRLSWLDEDFRDLVSPDKYRQNPRERYKKLKRASTLTPRQLSAAREIAAWRETRAIARDIPRKWVLSDEQIVEACKRGAKSVNDLYMVRGMRERLGIRDARMVASMMKDGFEKPKREWPTLSVPNKNEQNVDVVIDVMSALVRKRARENDIAMNTLASHADLVALARGYTQDSNVLRGWRADVVGKELLALVAGNIKLRVIDCDIEIEHVE